MTGNLQNVIDLIVETIKLQLYIGRNLQKKAQAAVIGVVEAEKCPAEIY